MIESAGLAYRAAGGEQTAAVLDPAANSRPAAMPYPPPDTPAILKYLKGQVRTITFTHIHKRTFITYFIVLMLDTF